MLAYRIKHRNRGKVAPSVLMERASAAKTLKENPIILTPSELLEISEREAVANPLRAKA